jgi:sterol desaturase/sphingolipid hydroxylase (fatty acid hydroxylase superfamily)
LIATTAAWQSNATEGASAVFDAIVDHNSNVGGFIVGLITVAFTACLELISFPHVKRVLSEPGGKRLYLTALFYNGLNNLVLGPVIWLVAVGLMCRPDLPTMSDRVFSTMGLLLVHSLGYYAAHAAMHRPELFRYHALHHRFHTHVTPFAANCVTVVEYLIAYMLPFVVGIFCFRPDRLALLRAVCTISVNNILIHTPILSEPAEKYLPWVFVGTHDHLEHHSQLTTKYAAPTISIDRLLEYGSAAMGVNKPHWPGPKPRAAKKAE